MKTKTCNDCIHCVWTDLEEDWDLCWDCDLGMPQYSGRDGETCGSFESFDSVYNKNNY